MQAVITVGAPGCGKSTLAREIIQEGEAKGETWVEINRDVIRFTKVQPGGTWATWKWKLEDRVTEIQNDMIQHAATARVNVIISDTNTNFQGRMALNRKLQELGYEVSYHTFEDVSFEEMVKRDAVRHNGVGAHVIYRHHLAVQEQFRQQRYTPDESKRNAIIVDIDGTIAEMHDRGAFEWSKVGQDKCREHVVVMVEAMALQYEADVLLTSGRDAVCRDETLRWAHRNGVWYHPLFMRPQGDMRKDTIIKEEIFWEHIAPHYNVIAAFDDRPCVLRLWHEIGIKNVISVGNPFLEF